MPKPGANKPKGVRGKNSEVSKASGLGDDGKSAAGKIKEAFDADQALSNLLLAPYFVQTMKECESAWRQVL